MVTTSGGPPRTILFQNIGHFYSLLSHNLYCYMVTTTILFGNFVHHYYLIRNGLNFYMVLLLHGHHQAPAFSGISIRDGTGRDFSKIPGSGDFSGRD